MQVISVNVGQPREVESAGRTVTTSIFKSPVEGVVQVGRLNLEGDAQADLTVHGGVSKAVYVYPAEHYPFWHSELPEIELSWGAFGENLTTEGLDESEIGVGDVLRIGTARFAVSEPRLPCFKLGIRLGRADAVKRFLISRRSGFYLRVLDEGELSAGDDIEIAERHTERLPVLEIVELFAAKSPERERVERALAHPALPEHWRGLPSRGLDTTGASG